MVEKEVGDYRFCDWCGKMFPKRLMWTIGGYYYCCPEHTPEETINGTSVVEEEK